MCADPDKGARLCHTSAQVNRLMMPTVSLLGLLLSPSAHADGPVPGQGSLVGILTPARGAHFNEGDPTPVDAEARLWSRDIGAWDCVWYLDRDEVSRGPFDQAGFCPTTFDVSALSAGTHAFRVEAVHHLLGTRLIHSLYFTTNSAPEVVVTAPGACAGTEGLFDVEIELTDFTFTTAASGVPAKGEHVLVDVALDDGSGTRVGGTDPAHPIQVTLGDDGKYTLQPDLPVPGGATDGEAFTVVVTATDEDGAEGHPASPGIVWVQASDSATYYDGARHAPDGTPAIDTPATAVLWSIESDADYQTYPFFVEVPGAGADGVSFGYSGAASSDLAGTCTLWAGDTWQCSLGSGALTAGIYDVYASTHGECPTIDTLQVELINEYELVDNDRDGLAESESDSSLNDCDDHDFTVYPGNGRADQCDTADVNCDGVLNDAAMDPNEGVGGNDELATATESGVTTTNGGGTYTLGEGNLHSPDDQDWWAFRVGDGGRTDRTFTLTLELPEADCATAVTTWSVGVWGTRASRDNADEADVSLAADAGSHLSFSSCVDLGSTVDLTWEIADHSGSDQPFWWATVYPYTWRATSCADNGAPTYTLTVTD